MPLHLASDLRGLSRSACVSIVVLIVVPILVESHRRLDRCLDRRRIPLADGFAENDGSYTQ